MTRKGKGTVYRYRGKWRAQGPREDDGSRAALGTFETEAEAWRRIDAYHQLTAGKPTGMTVAAWGEKWFLDRRVRSEKKERSVWRAHIASSWIADRLIKRLSRQDILAWLRELEKREAVSTRTTGKGAARKTTTKSLGRTLSWQTRKHALRVLMSALEGALDAGVLTTNPARGIRLKREGEAHLETHAAVEGSELGWTWLTSSEIERLLAVEPRYATEAEAELLDRSKAIWTVGIFTGLRPGEIWGLRWCDIRLDGDTPSIQVRRSRRGPPKTRHALRDVPLLPVVVETLKRWKKTSPGIGEALVFPSSTGGCHAEGYDANFGVYRKLAGIVRPGITPRSWRHTYASHLIQGTWTARPLRLEELRQVMGHSSIGVTQRYAHLAPGGVRDAILGPVGATHVAHIKEAPTKNRPEK